MCDTQHNYKLLLIMSFSPQAFILTIPTFLLRFERGKMVGDNFRAMKVCILQYWLSVKHDLQHGKYKVLYLFYYRGLFGKTLVVGREQGSTLSGAYSQSNGGFSNLGEITGGDMCTDECTPVRLRECWRQRKWSFPPIFDFLFPGRASWIWEIPMWGLRMFSKHIISPERCCAC